MRAVLLLAGVLMLSGALARADKVWDRIEEARQLRKDGKANEAAKILRELIEANREDLRPYPDLAYIFFTEMNMIGPAAELLTHYVDVTPEDDYARKLLRTVAERALSVGEARLAMEAVQVLREKAPRDPDLLKLLAESFWMQGDRASVRAACHELILHWPSDEYAYWLLAREHMEDGEFGEAARVYRDFIEERPGDVRIRLSLASLLLYYLYDLDAAAAEYENILSIAEPGGAEYEEAADGVNEVNRRRALVQRLADHRRFLRIVTGLALAVLAGFAAWAFHSTRPREEKGRPAVADREAPGR